MPVDECPDEDSEVVYLPDDENCSIYYECRDGMPILDMCVGDLFFNPVINACEYPENTPCEMTMGGGDEDDDLDAYSLGA